MPKNQIKTLSTEEIFAARPQIKEIVIEGDDSWVVAQCSNCHGLTYISATLEQLTRWIKGEVIQNVLPTVSPNKREVLVSGICGECFDKLLAEDD